MIPHNRNYIHHQKPGIAASVREVVFGMEDGMVSTMGAITGIAVGSGDHFVIVLAGLVIVSVESISMGVGSYLSNKSEREVDMRMLDEETEEIHRYPKEEKEEMYGYFVKDGWPKELAKDMADAAGNNKKLMLKEMAYRELGVSPKKEGKPIKNGFLMLGSYVIGGTVPLLPYLLISNINTALTTSVILTLIGLFALGAGTTQFSLVKWWKGGLQMCLLASFAGLIGYLGGVVAERFLM